MYARRISTRTTSPHGATLFRVHPNLIVTITGDIIQMNIQFQRAVDRYAGVPICALLSLVNRVVSNEPDGTPPKNILVILLSEMGSLVLAHPMFMRLKQLYPEAQIHVLMFAKNREVLDLLDVIPRENVMTLDDGSLKGLVGDSLRAIRRMHKLKIDVVIDCELFARISSIFSYLSGASTRVGFHPHTQEGLYRGSFINRPVLYNPYRHLTQQFLTLASALESTTDPVAKLLPAPYTGKTPVLEFPIPGAAQLFSGNQGQETGVDLPERRDPADTRLAAQELFSTEQVPAGRGLCGGCDRHEGRQGDFPVCGGSLQEPGLRQSGRIYPVSATSAGGIPSCRSARHQRWRSGTIRCAYAAAAHHYLFRAGNTGAVQIAGRQRLLLPPPATLLTLPHCIQSPHLALRWR
jgi:hypothetical protein